MGEAWLRRPRVSEGRSELLALFGPGDVVIHGPGKHANGLEAAEAIA